MAARLALLALCACDPGAFDELTGGGGADAMSEGAAGRDGERDGAAGDAGPAKPDGGGRDAALDMDSGPEAGPPPLDASMDASPDASPPAEAGPPACPHVPDLESVPVRLKAKELGEISLPSELRLGTVNSAQVGSHVLWIFGSPHGAKWGEPGPVSAPPDLQMPQPAAPLLPEGAVPNDRSATLSGAVAVSDTEALIYFVSGFFFDLDDMGLARIAFDQVEAEIVKPAGELFPYRQSTGGEPRVWIPLFGAGIFAHEEDDGTYIYLYACNADPDAPTEQPGGSNAEPCRIARVRREQAGDGTRYRYWNGSDWDSDRRAARIVINHVPGSLSVSYNQYLQKFLAVHSHGTADRIVLRWADRPEGPWHDLGSFITLEATADFPTVTISGFEHVGLRDACQQTIYVSYLLPLIETDPQTTAITTFHPRLVSVKLE